MSTSSYCFSVVTGGASRRFLGSGRTGFHVSCQELHPEHAGDVRGPALPHGSAVRPHHQARDAGVEGQVERRYRAGEVPFSSPAGQKAHRAPHAVLRPGPGKDTGVGNANLTEGGGCLDSCCVCIFVVPPMATLGPSFNCYTHFFLFVFFPDCACP